MSIFNLMDDIDESIREGNELLRIERRARELANEKKSFVVHRSEKRPDWIVKPVLASMGRIGSDQDDYDPEDLEEFNKLSRQEVVDHWLQWQGIRGYTTDIIDLVVAVQQMEK